MKTIKSKLKKRKKENETGQSSACFRTEVNKLSVVDNK